MSGSANRRGGAARGSGRGGRGGRTPRGKRRGAGLRNRSKAARAPASNDADWPFLHLDLCGARGRVPPALPVTPVRTLPGNMRLQIVVARDLSVPTVGRVDLSDDTPPGSSATSEPSRRLLQLTLTDGYREIVGLEIARVPDFDSRSARVPGTKVVLLGDDIRVCDGFALLRPRNVRVLGGVVPHLKRRHEQKMMRHDPFQGLYADSTNLDQDSDVDGSMTTKTRRATGHENNAGTMPPPFEEYDPEAERAALEQEERAIQDARIAAAKRAAALRGVNPNTMGAAAMGGVDGAMATRSFAQRHRERKEMEAQAQSKGLFGVKEALALVLRRSGQRHEKNKNKRSGSGTVLTVEDVVGETEGEGEVDQDTAESTQRFGLRGIAASLDLVAAGSVPQLVFVIKDADDIESEVRLPVSSTLLLVLLGLANAKGAPPLHQLWATSKGKKFVGKRVKKLEAALITGAQVTFRVEKAKEETTGSWQIVNLES